MKQPIESQTALLILFSVGVLIGGFIIFEFQTTSENSASVLSTKATPAVATTTVPSTDSSASEIDSRDSMRISDLHEIQNDLEFYYNACGRYPGAAVSAIGCPAANERIYTFADASAALIESDLNITTLPNDPSAGATYYYGTNDTGSLYVLAARLEDVTNPVFLDYDPPSLAGISASGLTSCLAPMYCVTL